MRIVSAASVSLEAYADAFTSAFRGYWFPIVFDAAVLARRVRFEQHDLENSLVAFDGDRAAGVAGLAVRGARGWVAGLAVVPEQRGRGRGRELMSALLERARGAGLRRLSLEVLSVNEPARRLYESFGMRVTRDLLILERAAGEAVRAPRLEFKPGEATAAELLTHFARLHAEPPAWQRDLPSLLAADLRGFYVGERRRPDAYALVGYGRDGNTYVSDLAAADAAHARSLCAALGGMRGTLKVINEPAQSPFAAALLEHGFRETARQHEMSVEL